MTINKQQLVELLKGNTSLTIPFFQRKYVWTFKNEIKVLIDDLLRCKHQDYFVGSVILKNKANTRLIIDGQQRITTALLLIKAIIVILQQLNCDLQVIEKWTNVLNYFNFKNYTTEQSDALEQIIQSCNDVQCVNKDIYSKTFQELLEYLKKEFYTIEKITALEIAINKITFAVVIFDAEIDEHILFAQINSTGKKLSEFDLFKNYLLSELISLYKCKNEFISSKELDAMIKKHVVEIDNINESLNEYASKDIASNLLRSFLAYKTKTLPSKNKTYKYFIECREEWKKEQNYDVQTFYQEYINFASAYKFIYLKEYKKIKDLKEHHFALFHSEFDTYCCLLVHIILTNSEINNQQLVLKNINEIVQSLAIVEYYLISRKFAGFNDKEITRKIPTIKYDVEKLMQQYNLSYSQALYIILIWLPIKNSEAGNNYLYRCTNINELQNNFLKKEIYLTNGNFCKSLLIKLANLQDKKATYDYKDFSIEHVMPQDLSLWLENGFIINEEEFNLYKHSIGNLTLTKYNSEVSNKPFIEKISFLKENESFVLNNYFLNMNLWTIDEIIKRSKYLFTLLSQQWNFLTLENNIAKIVELNQLLNYKANVIYDSRIDTMMKNKTYFRKYNIDFDKAKEILFAYHETHSGIKAEQKILNHSCDGWVVKSLCDCLQIGKNKQYSINDIALLNDPNFEFIFELKKAINIIHSDNYFEKN